jgi:hypothetical protein
MAAKTVAIRFPLSTSPGSRPQESAGRLINCFGEPLGQNGPSSVVYRRAPGLASFGTTVKSGYRGSLEVNGTVYSAFNGALVSHNSAGGAATNIGTLNGTKKGFFARNNKSPTPDQVFVDPDGNIATFTSSAVTNGYPDADLPAVNSVTVLDGFLLFTTGSGQIWASDLNATSLSALSFTTAQAKPDGLLRGIAYASMFLAMGNTTIEVYTDVGSTPFPLNRSTVIACGLIGPYAVAGHEDGFNGGLLWVANDNTVRQLNGYSPDKVSPPDLDRLIEATTDKTTLEAYAYMSGGHAFWELTGPNFSWVYDLNTQKWHERAAYQSSISRIAGTIFAFGTTWLCGDRKTGNILKITNASFQGVADPFRMRIESCPVESFPNRIRVARADFDFVVGVGQASGLDPIQTDPSVEISWSDDGGLTWSNPAHP